MPPLDQRDVITREDRENGKMNKRKLGIKNDKI